MWEIVENFSQTDEAESHAQSHQTLENRKVKSECLSKLTSNVSNEACSGGLSVSLILCGEGWADEEVHLDQVSWGVQVELLNNEL